MRRPAGLSPLDSSEPGRKKMWVLPLVLIVVVILIAGGFFFFKGKQFSSEEEVTAALGGEKNVEVSPIASGAYQAVFLDNGQISIVWRGSIISSFVKTFRMETFPRRKRAIFLLSSLETRCTGRKILWT